jgi:uncharacterized protein YegL
MIIAYHVPNTMSSSDLQSLKSFLKTIIADQDMKQSGRTRVALVAYADTARTDYDLVTYASSGGYTQYTNVFNAIDNIQLMPGSGNNFGVALQQCHSLYTQVPSTRSLYPRVVLFIADQASSNPSDTQNQANSVKVNDNAFIVTVGVGGGASQSELTQMASTITTSTAVVPTYYTASSYATGVFDVNFVASVVQAACIPPPNFKSK